MRVLSVVSELFPVIKTGGLADVAGALPAALAPLGVRMVTLLPGYPAVLAALAAAQELRVYPDLFGGPARLLAGETAGLALFVIDAPHLYARQGNPYVGPDGRDWPDNGLRFAALGAVASDVGAGSVVGFVPDVVHAHDWQAGLAPAYLHYNLRRRPGTIMTVHNLAFQGQFPPQLLPVLGLPPESFTIEGVEYYGAIGYLKAGLRLADRITTVSPTYAAEIQTDAGGMGLAGLLRSRARDLAGILNGIDVTAWDPAADALIPEPFDAGSLARRAADKAALQARLGLARDPGMLLFGVVSRLTWQKGMDLLREALPVLLGLPAQLAMIGSGDPGLEAEFLRAAAEHPGRVGVRLGYDERLAHLVQAGADALIVPSRFEPCGLTQLCALRYGALPVVARVGGLADTVIDANEMALAAGVATGFQFSPPAGDALVAGLRRAAAVWAAPETWRAMQRNAMRCDVSWRGPAARYAALYNEVGR